MSIDLVKILSDSPLMVLFLVLGFGYALGKVHLGRFELGSTAGVLLMGLSFGHFGFRSYEEIGTVGFCLFIYSVGHQAGPRFFSVLAEHGRKYLFLAFVAALSAILPLLILSGWLGFGYGFPAGILAGSLTSTPTLAAAQGTIESGLGNLPPGMSEEVAQRNVTIGYAITYLFGTVGLLALLRFLPRVLGIDLVQQAKFLEARTSGARGRADGPEDPVIRAYGINNPDLFGKSLAELDLLARFKSKVVRIKRSGKPVQPGGEAVLREGDRIAVSAHLETHDRLRDYFGSEVRDHDLLRLRLDSRDIVVTNREYTGDSLRELAILSRFGCTIVKIVRSQIVLPVTPETVLNVGDTVTIRGLKESVEQFSERLGHEERSLQETDLLTFAFGISLGLLLGQVSIQVGQLTISLGMAGGLLVSGIAVGYLRSMHPTFGGIPGPARWILRELGLMLFMATVGLRAGTGVIEALLSQGVSVFLSGVVVTTLPVIVTFLIGLRVLRLNPVLLIGALAGAMTSTPALNATMKDTDSSIPALGYAGTYAFSNVVLTIAGSMMTRF